MKTVEICCGSYEDALNAYHGGAKRIELNSALALGGLTPTIATLRLIKENTDLKVIAMVRPRAGGFHYSDEMYDEMYYQAIELLDYGADGIAFGFLDQYQRIDLKRTKNFVELIKGNYLDKEIVFHRAFDLIADKDEAMKQLIYLHVDRVLTSGGKKNVDEGIDMLKHLQECFGERIQILAGCGINSSNAKTIIYETGIQQIHSSCKAWQDDLTSYNDDLSYDYGKVGQYDYVSQKKVKELIESIEK